MTFAASKPLISIVTPTYNRAKLLVRTIESIRQQNFQNWEHIIIDDGSTDNTAEVVQQYLSDQRIKYIKRSNAGAAAARNFGVSLARGEMICFLDSDDEALQDWLQTVSSFINESIGAISVGAIRKFEGGKAVIEKPFIIRMNRKEIKAKLICGSFFFRKEIFESIGGYDERISSGFQTELGLRILKEVMQRNLQIVHSDQCLVQINIHKGERMRNDWKTLVRDHSLFLEKVHQFYYENDKQELSNNYAVLAYYYHRSGMKKNALKNICKAIRYKPSTGKNYLRAISYCVA